MMGSTEQETPVVTGLREVFATGRTRDIGWRLEQLRGIERMCDECEQEIVEALAADLGRPAFDGWLADIASTKAEAAYARKHLKKWMRRLSVGLPLSQWPGKGWVQYDPLGVVLVIGAWNYPFYLSVGPLVAAVAAGNCAVVKPSELAPATSVVLARLLPKYLDPEAIQVVEGDGAMTQALLAQGFDHALFTGGTEVGKKIMAGAAPTLTPVTLELGGKSPVIVTADADIDVAARRIAWVKLLNSGQTCIAPDYVLAERPIADELVAKIAENIERFRSAERTKSQRIINDRQFDRLVGLIASTTGTIVTGGAADRSTLCIEPTVIIDPAADDPVMTEEIFGPILPVVRVGSADAAIRYVNAKPKPLALYVFTESTSQARRIIDAVPSGGAVVNHIAMHVMVPQLPFGGVGPSGIGAYHGRWGFEAMSHRRAVLAKRSSPDPTLFYPPYGRMAMKLMRKVF
ncbi:aldehyde dehydrogenase [Mycolicibacterium mucogenicum]|uniref:Aldehyde dehydrogenase n=1 Tax=Mycolicibacterium mucogenicum TaxID=56689 RepID=A0A1A3H8M6_MYCMU|nr:aldehyde dehydrogenase family protein [Mycolicibacterium mucogenicum]OBJ44637.1 aldehyde dehydrogenase [Mycolicibacterium mucogenicum]